MIELMRQWLTGVTCAALISALADGLMPKGPVKQVGKLVCALVLLCTVLRPVLTLKPLHQEELANAVRNAVREQQSQLEQGHGVMLKTLIERECAAYIVDKAACLGVTCQVRVVCIPGEDGIWLPQSAQMCGNFDEIQRRKLSAAIRDELGIAAARQIYTGGE